MKRNSILGVSILLFLPSCTSSTPAPTSTLIRDSAGIRIVQNSHHILESSPKWTLTPDPALKLGALEGEDPFQFHRVTGVVLLGDLVWVLDRGSCQLRAFSLDGSHVRSVGGVGEGPGEFLWPGRLVALEPDTLLVWDQRNQRISYFDTEGNYLRSTSVYGRLLSPSFVSALEDGSFLFSSFTVTFPATDAVEESPLYLIRIDQGGHLMDTVGVFPHLRMKRVENGRDLALVTYSPVTWVSGDRGTFWIGTGEHPEIEERNPSGELVQLLRWQTPDRTVRPEHIEADFSVRLAEAGTAEARRRVQRTRDHVPVAEQFPSLADLREDRAGRVWILEYGRPGESEWNQWIIFGISGEITARIRLPRSFRPHEFGEDYVLGVTRGELDEEYVVLYGIQRPKVDS